VERRRAPDDGRAVVICLTRKGRQAAAELSKLAQRWSDGVLQRIPNTQRGEVIAALETVIGAVNDCCATGCEPELVQLQRR
jgi:DNA-binding MarR family transcriptional regulator